VSMGKGGATTGGILLLFLDLAQTIQRSGKRYGY
jgi:hypothetical protein